MVINCGVHERVAPINKAEVHKQETKESAREN